MYVAGCVCMCVCVCRGGGRGGLTGFLFFLFVADAAGLLAVLFHVLGVPLTLALVGPHRALPALVLVLTRLCGQTPMV